MAFLATLEAEQARYLDAIGRARAALDGNSPHLAEMSAVQGRLTRRFFDAQRAILQQRAQVDDAIGSMLSELTFVAPITLGHGRFERQLDALLDEWWVAEQRSCAAATAIAPVADEMHSPEAVLPAIDLPPMPADVLPPSLVDALTSADPTQLDRILDELVADFTAHAAVAAAAVPAVVPAAPAPHDEGALTIVGGTLEEFELFWAAEPQQAAVVADEAPAEPSFWAQVPTGIVLPIVGVTAGIALVMALVG